MNKLSKKQVTFYVDENILFNFKRRFPRLSANFFQTVFMSSDELLNSKMDV